MEIERQPELFTSGGGAQPGSHNPILQNQPGDAFTKTLTGGSLRILETLTYLDPPEHTMHRALVSRAFTPKRMSKLIYIKHCHAFNLRNLREEQSI